MQKSFSCASVDVRRKKFMKWDDKVLSYCSQNSLCKTQRSSAFSLIYIQQVDRCLAAACLWSDEILCLGYVVFLQSVFRPLQILLQ